MDTAHTRRLSLPGAVRIGLPLPAQRGPGGKLAVLKAVDAERTPRTGWFAKRLYEGPVGFSFPMLFSGVADVCEWYERVTVVSRRSGRAESQLGDDSSDIRGTFRGSGVM